MVFLSGEEYLFREIMKIMLYYKSARIIIIFFSKLFIASE